MPLDNKVVPVAWLRTQFNYDAKTGLITNAEGRKGAKPGADPTYPIKKGYRALKVHYRGVRYTFLADRLAWALRTGKHPTHEAQNNAARGVKLRDLPKGVSKLTRASANAKPYRAQFCHRGVRRHLGCFATPEEAATAYAAEAERCFGNSVRVA